MRYNASLIKLVPKVRGKFAYSCNAQNASSWNKPHAKQNHTEFRRSATLTRFKGITAQQLGHCLKSIRRNSKGKDSDQWIFMNVHWYHWFLLALLAWLALFCVSYIFLLSCFFAFFGYVASPRFLKGFWHALTAVTKVCGDGPDGRAWEEPRGKHPEWVLLGNGFCSSSKTFRIYTVKWYKMLINVVIKGYHFCETGSIS